MNDTNETTELKATPGKLIVLRDERKLTTHGGVALPNKPDGSNPARFGKVLSVGIGDLLWDGDFGDRNEPQCRVGDRILYIDYDSKPLDERNKRLISIEERKVLAVVG